MPHTSARTSGKAPRRDLHAYILRRECVAGYIMVAVALALSYAGGNLRGFDILWFHVFFLFGVHTMNLSGTWVLALGLSLHVWCSRWLSG